MENASPIIAVGYMAIAFIAYFLPTFIASNRKHHNGTAIFLVNLVLGWTLIGWFMALLWSFSAIMQTKKDIDSEQSSDKYDQLNKLVSLKEGGHLSDDEFEREKSKILNR